MPAKLTDAQRYQIQLLRMNGLSYLAIAKKIKCHPETVGKFCRTFKDALTPSELLREKTLWQKIKAWVCD